MAISVSNQGSASCLPNAVTNFALTSITGTYYFVTVPIGGSTTIPTVTSTVGISFTQLSSIFDGSNTNCWTFGGICTSGTSGNIVITRGATGTGTIVAGVDKVTGLNPGSPIVRTVTGGNPITMSGWGKASNVGYLVTFGAGDSTYTAVYSGAVASTYFGPSTTTFVATTSAGSISELNNNVIDSFTTTVVNSTSLLGCGI